MRWELRQRAAERGITTSAEVRRRLAAAGLCVSAGKMSALWSTTPVSVRLEDLEVICAVLSFEPSDLLIRQATAATARPEPATPASAQAPPSPPGVMPASAPAAGVFVRRPCPVAGTTSGNPPSWWTSGMRTCSAVRGTAGVSSWQWCAAKGTGAASRMVSLGVRLASATRAPTVGKMVGGTDVPVHPGSSP
ncbi:helix-turn-helix domain-containing protein [Streptomyces sp. NPDC001811]